LSDYITGNEGRFIDIDTGKAVASHAGAEFFTNGESPKIGGLVEK
jgi:hypothetical protein